MNIKRVTNNVRHPPRRGRDGSPSRPGRVVGLGVDGRMEPPRHGDAEKSVGAWVCGDSPGAKSRIWNSRNQVWSRAGAGGLRRRAGGRHGEPCGHGGRLGRGSADVSAKRPYFGVGDGIGMPPGRRRYGERDGGCAKGES